MKQYKIAVLPGDGIGPEVTSQAIRVIERIKAVYGFSIECKEALIGGAAIDAAGTPLPDETLVVCRESDAVLLGAVGGGKWNALPPEIRPEAGLLGIRKELGLFANLRPAVVFNPLRNASPLKPEIIGEHFNLLIVRELTGGMYFGKRSRTAESASDTEEYSAYEVERIARVAFSAAQKRQGRMCSVDKANVLESSRLWRETIERVSKEYPTVELSHMYVDNCAMQLVRNPRQFDVIVTSNMFGDILSDEASMITGSIGMLPSASLGEGAFGGKNFGLYEPIHGSAPDIAGKDIANPCATVLSIAMMLRYSFGENQAAEAIEKAVESTLQKYRTADIWQDDLKTIEKVGCRAMGDAILSFV